MLTFGLFLLGLCLGSFVNAFVWRLRKKKNWISERSVCTHCKHVLAPKDLVPLISWLMLRGRCRYCHKKIEDSPLVELSVAFIYVISYLAWPYGFETIGWIRFVIWLMAVVLLVSMFIYDKKWMILPDKLTYALLILAIIQLILIGLIDSDSWVSLLSRAGLSALVGGGIFHLIYIGSKGAYIGGGDVKLGYAYGLLMIYPIQPWLTLTLASVIGSLFAIGLIIAGKAKMTTKLPFGTMLISAAIVVYLWGDQLWDHIGRLWY